MVLWRGTGSVAGIIRRCGRLGRFLAARWGLTSDRPERRAGGCGPAAASAAFAVPGREAG
jgi:hypothetical protein